MPVNYLTAMQPGTKGPQTKLNDPTATYAEKNFTLSGITRDSNGNALASCTVMLFNTLTNICEQTIVSDASGNYSFVVDKTQTYYEVSYKAGAPDVTGATVNTLVGT